MLRDMSDFFNTGLLITGTAIVALGMTTVGIYTFQDSFKLSSVGYFLFVIGYKICWFSAHENVNNFEQILSRGKAFLNSENRFNEFRFHILSVIGVLVVSYGTTQFAQNIVADPPIGSGLSALTISLGYITAHIGVNRVII